jgi:hypothetical protein
MTVAQQNVLRLENEALKKKIELMQQLTSFQGFYNMFFLEVAKQKNRETAFNVVNGLFFDLFGKYKYSCYANFRQAVSNNFKKNKK